MADNRKYDTTVDIKSLQCSFENIMSHNFSMSPNCSIFRTPTTLYRQNEAAYKPNAFSFGPFHYGKQLEFTQKIKWEYLQGLLRRSRCPEELYRQLINAIRSVQGEARVCYAESIELDANEFVEVLLFDGCFIIELFRKDANKVPKDPHDPIFTMACLQEYLYNDLILLENQIPWLVLECLLSLTKVSEKESLTQLALDYFGYMFSATKLGIKQEEFQKRKIEIKHILDLLRHSLLLPLPQEKLNPESSGWEPIPNATRIKEAGIKFKRGTDASSVLDIKFRNGVLEIPPLLVQETTETIFRNLISFEQCFPNYQPLVTSYAKFMDNLIETDRDIEILCLNDTLDNWLNPEDAKKFLKKLSYDAYVKQFFYHEINQKVNRHRNRWWSRLRVFYLDNFTTPWAIVSQVVGVILLILAFLQTLYSIFNVVGQKGR